MDKLWQKQEDKWADFQRKQREGWKEEEAAEEQKHRENVQKLKSGRLEQLEERGRHFQRLKEQKEQEKEQLRKQLEEDEQRAKQKEEAKRKKIQESKEDFIASNMAQKARKEAEKLRLKESDRKIAEFATYRDRVEQERKEAYAKKQSEENARRDVILTRLEKQLLEARVDNETRLQNQAAAHKEAEDRREQERAERARADWEQCDISRKQQISMRKEQLARDKSDDMEEAMGVRERIKSVEAEEKAELRKTRERNTVFAKENLRLAAERQEHECREREEEKREYQNAYELMEHNDVPDDLLLTDDD